MDPREQFRGEWIKRSINLCSRFLQLIIFFHLPILTAVPMYVVDQGQHPLLVRMDPPSLNKNFITHTDLLRLQVLSCITAIKVLLHYYTLLHKYFFILVHLPYCTRKLFLLYLINLVIICTCTLHVVVSSSRRTKKTIVYHSLNRMQLLSSTQ